jgi:hypothetical protein
LRDFDFPFPFITSVASSSEWFVVALSFCSITGISIGFDGSGT